METKYCWLYGVKSLESFDNDVVCAKFANKCPGDNVHNGNGVWAHAHTML